MRDSSEEVQNLIEDYKNSGFEYGKSLDYLEWRLGCSKEEMEKQILAMKDLVFTQKQKREEETRYKLYYVYNKRKGRAYIITFRDKIRVVTAFPLGPHTLNKYHKTRFKK